MLFHCAMFVKNTYIFLLFFFLLAQGLCAAPAGLGESLLLEGKVALQRGESWVLGQQGPDGSWQNDPVLTAQAAILLANSDSQQYSESLRLAMLWMQKTLRAITQPGDFAQALRLPLRLQNPDLPAMVKVFRQKKDSWELALESLLTQQWLLEAHFLLPPELPLLSLQEVELLQRNFLREKDSFPAFALLTMLGGAEQQEQEAALRHLSSACRKQTAAAEAEDLFWIVRALRMAERFLPRLDKTWRAEIAASILEKQDGQGAFAKNAEQRQTADLKNTVFYLQIIQLCLTETE